LIERRLGRLEAQRQIRHATVLAVVASREELLFDQQVKNFAAFVAVESPQATALFGSQA
jgi:hypothetical protein